MKAKHAFLFLVGICSLVALSISVQGVKGQGEPYAALYPSEGSASTDVYLQVRNLEVYCPYPNWYDYGGAILYLFWDDICLMQNVPNNYPWARGVGYDLSLSSPQVHPYSDLGNHNVTMQIQYWGDHIFNLTFTIIEYAPSPEYVALNATYYELLGNYTTLLSNYDLLLGSYTALIADHNEVLTNYNNLFTSYDSLAKHYGSLNSSYDGLTDDYDSLKANYNSLQTNYNSLKADLDSLESSNSNLATSYDTLIGELSYTRNLSYLFAATTMVLIATTVYFAFRKTKVKTT